MPKPSSKSGRQSGKLIGKKVSILWEDAYSDDDWAENPENIEEVTPMMVEIVGFLVWDSSQGVGVAREKFCDGRYRSLQYIPRGMVKGVKVL